MTQLETFPALEALPFLRSAFLGRDESVDVVTDRETALDRLARSHREARERAGFGGYRLANVEQVHGNNVAVVSDETTTPVLGCDGLITRAKALTLSIAVADCAAVFLTDCKGRGIGLVHSGSKGTQLGIVPVAVERFCEVTGARASEVILQISPCIRPPNYETDFASEIADQAKRLGVGQIFDCGICTASHPSRYYSYRRERGQTGRMLALLALVP